MIQQQKILTPNIFLRELKQVHNLLLLGVLIFLLLSCWSIQSLFEVFLKKNDVMLPIVTIILTACIILEKIIFKLRLKQLRNCNILKEKVLKYYKITANRYLILSLLISFSILITLVMNTSIYITFPILLMVYYSKLRVSKKKVILDLNLQGTFLHQFNRLYEEFPENI